ncbi:hypothetical protein FRC08_010418 [Ceratobasidium sp. 394]|nr:hypothetical protein FRC08_010418 [Ceratobasidium sp. 394]
MFGQSQNQYAQRLAQLQSTQKQGRIPIPVPGPSATTRLPTSSPARIALSQAQSRKDLDSDVEMQSVSKVLFVYNPSALKRTRDEFESAIRDDHETMRQKRRVRHDELPVPSPASGVVAIQPPNKITSRMSPPRPPSAIPGPSAPCINHANSSHSPEARRAGPARRSSNTQPPSQRHEHEVSKSKAPSTLKPADQQSSRAQHAGRPTLSNRKPGPTGKVQRMADAPCPHSNAKRFNLGHKGKSKCPQTARSRASDFDDTDENDSDTETIVSLYANEPDTSRNNEFAKVLTVLERISGKLDQLLTSRPDSEAPAKQGPTQPSLSGNKPTTARATRRQDNLRPWDQTKDDNCFVGPQTRDDARKLVQAGLPDGPPDDVIVPTSENFYIKWNKSAHSEFNQIACELIVSKLSDDFPVLFNEDNYDHLMKMVKSHVKYLMRAYRWQQLPADDPTDETRHLNSSANRRMHTMHKDLIVRLGIDGTSSDEEDPDNPGVYRVKKIKQLSSSVRDLKQKLDHAYEVLEKGRKAQGSRGRKRVPTNEASSRKFRIQGLPKNCLNRVWMHRLSDAQKSFFKLVDYDYDFSFPDEILKL